MIKRYDLIDWTAEAHNHYVPFQGRNAETDIQNKSILPRIPIKVPGSIYDALVTAGLLEDPFYEMNSLKAQWVAGYWWKYETELTMSLPAEGERAELVLEGVDYKGHIFFNGQKVGYSENMYVPFVADVTALVREGANKIAVVLENAPDEIGQIGYTSLTTTQKARFTYKWDWCTRLISIGLYRPAYIRIYDTVRVENFYFKPIGIEGDAEIYVDLHGNTEGCTVRASIGGASFESGLDFKYRKTAKGRVHVDDVKLWYPINEGEQYLYDLVIEVLKDGNVIHAETHKVGFRQIKLEPNDNAPIGALNYTFTVNGKKVYARGVNLTPLDHTCYTDPVKLEALLTLMKKANMNVIRVWGGGVIEDEIFYDLCDRMGFMIWQEFIQSSSGIDNIPSKHEKFLVNQHKTAQWATKTRRNHPSLAVWSGGNELMDGDWVPVDFGDRNIGELLGIVTQNSPHVPMLPTSASGPWEFLDINHPGENHDVHGPWQYAGETGQYHLFNNSDSMFHSEFGVDGMLSLRSMKKFLSEENIKVTSMGENCVWRHHGEWWDSSHRDNHIFGVPETIEQQIGRSQYIQAEGLRYGLEANRRRAYQNSGSIIWQINEPYPNICSTTLIDYYNETKPVFWQVGKAFAPLNVNLKYDKLIWEPSEEFTAEVYICLDGEEQEVEYTYTAGGKTVTGKAVAGRTGGVLVGEVKCIAGGKYIDIALSAKAADGKTFENAIRLLVRQPNGLCADEGILGFYPETQD